MDRVCGGVHCANGAHNKKITTSYNVAVKNTRILSTRIIVPVFMPFLAIGLMALGLPVIFLLAQERFVLLPTLWCAVIAALSFGIAYRPRVIRLDQTTGDISISWGVRFPWIYQRFPISTWIGFRVTKEFPVVVMGNGAGYARASQLPPHWHLHGMTKKGKSISFGVAPSEKDATATRAFLQEKAKLHEPFLPITVRLSYGVGRTTSADAGWKDEPYFKKHSNEGRLYEQLCASAKWRCLTAGNIYDADVPEELGCHDFDVPLLASNADLRKPWKRMRALEDEGWVSSGPHGTHTPIRELEVLESRYGWAVPSMRVLS